MRAKIVFSGLRYRKTGCLIQKLSIRLGGMTAPRVASSLRTRLRPFLGLLEAWDVVTHAESGARQNYLCWRHSAETNFESQGHKPDNVLTSFAISGFSKAPGTPENGAPVYAPASFAKTPAAAYAIFAVAPNAR